MSRGSGYGGVGAHHAPARSDRSPTAFDLEDAARQGPVGVSGIRRQQLGQRPAEVVRACSGDGRPEEDWKCLGSLTQLGKSMPERGARHGSPVQVTGQHRVVATGQQLGQGNLVDEDDGGDAEPAQGAHQHPGLCLHPLHGGDDEHRAVQHVEHPLDLSDEVGVTGGVDQVDGDIADPEGDDSSLDGDAAGAFQGERVGLCAALVDAADLVDNPGVVEQPLRQAGLTGVDMCQDPEVEQAHEASCP